MFGKLFSKKPKKNQPTSSKVNVLKNSISFIGDVDGAINGVDLVRLEVTKILLGHAAISNAWLSNVQYSGEDKIRIALIIESGRFNHDMGHAIALKCSEITPMDVLFSRTISSEDLDTLKSKSKALYGHDNKLYSIALIVKHGENEDMPEHWEQGIQLYITAAETIDLALHRTMAEAEIQKFQVERVFQDQILQIEPQSYWEDFVMDRFATSKDQMPSQEDINSLIKCGGLISSLCMQWHDKGLDNAF